MTVSRRTYDSVFSSQELKRIAFLRNLSKNRAHIAWLAGAVTVLTVFFLQMLFHGNALIRAVFSYGSLPSGVIIGTWLYFFIDRYTNNEFIVRWDPVFYERHNTTPDRLAAEYEVRQLTEDMHFITLPLEQQQLIVNGIYRKYGLPEPNATVPGNQVV